MSFQVCPICQGRGYELQPGWSIPKDDSPCSICKGKKIISVLTGKPPDVVIERMINE